MPQVEHSTQHADNSPWAGIASSYLSPPQGVLGSHILADGGIWEGRFQTAPAPILSDLLSKLSLAVMEGRNGTPDRDSCTWLNRSRLAMAAATAVLCHQRDSHDQAFGPIDVVLAADMSALEAAAFEGGRTHPTAIIQALKAAFDSFPMASWDAARQGRPQEQTVYDNHAAMVAAVASCMRSAFPDGLSSDYRRLGTGRQGHLS